MLMIVSSPFCVEVIVTCVDSAHVHFFSRHILISPVFSRVDMEFGPRFATWLPLLTLHFQLSLTTRTCFGLS
jgi:hypothetical protein